MTAKRKAPELKEALEDILGGWVVDVKVKAGEYVITGSYDALHRFASHENMARLGLQHTRIISYQSADAGFIYAGDLVKGKPRAKLLA